MTSDIDAYKQMTGSAAADLIEDGMAIGIGTGTTAAFLIQALATRLKNGLTIRGAVPTSEATARLASSLGIPLISLNDYPVLDLAIDGADEIDPQLNLIKGAGGALLREKIVATAARQFVVISHSAKLVSRLGTQAALPVEVTPFALTPVRRHLEQLDATVQLRMRAEQVFVTDNQNYILDCRFPTGIADPFALREQLRAIVGIVTSGLFLGMTQRVLIAGPQGLICLP
jgi:ribose 5-phosphate isomerase A